MREDVQTAGLCSPILRILETGFCVHKGSEGDGPPWGSTDTQGSPRVGPLPGGIWSCGDPYLMPGTTEQPQDTKLGRESTHQVMVVVWPGGGKAESCLRKGLGPAAPGIV